MQRAILLFAKTVIVLFLLSAFGWMVKHAVQGNLGWGPKINRGLVTFVSFFDLFEQTVEEVRELPKTFVPTPADFTPINQLENDVWGLVTYSTRDFERKVDLLNFRNDSTGHSWTIDNIKRAQNRIIHPIMTADRHLIYSLNGVTGLFAIDAEGDQLWKQDTIAHHHGLNFDADSNIWACSYDREPKGFIIYRGLIKVDGRPLNYIDNTVTQIDRATGHILYHKSLTDILVENDLTHLLLKTGQAWDPLHLNDVEPVLADGPYWNKGDLFLSMRCISTVLQFRPSTGEVIRVIDGPFYTQHDVDIINDSTLSIFNNNAHVVWQKTKTDLPIGNERKVAGDHYSNIVFYHMENDSVEFVEKQTFIDNRIYSTTESLADWLADGSVFVEEQNTGVLWVLKNGEVLYKNVLSSQHEGYHHLSNWTRIISNP